MSTRFKCELENKVRNYLYVRGRFEESNGITYLSDYKRLRDLFGFSSNKELFSFFEHKAMGGPGGYHQRGDCYLVNCVSMECRLFPTIRSLVTSIGIDYPSARDSIGEILRSGGCRLQIGGVWHILSRNRWSRRPPLCTNNMINIRLGVVHGIGRDLIYLDRIVRHYGVYRDRENDRQSGSLHLQEEVCMRLGIEYHPSDIEECRERRKPRATTLTRLRDGEVTRYKTMVEASDYLKTQVASLRVLYRLGLTYPFWWDRYSIDIE